MKLTKYKSILAALMLSSTLTGCFDLDEEVFDRVGKDIYYKDESSVKGSLAAIYNEGVVGCEFFYYLQEYSADQVAWRTWNGGAWGWDEGMKYVLSTHSWNSEAQYIRNAWEKAWKTIGLCNQLISDLNGLSAAELGISEEAMKAYIAETRTFRAWAYYNLFEIWGGALPLNIEVAGGDALPPTADPDFDTSCQKIYDFITTELDECYMDMKKNTSTRMNMAANRLVKARLLLNAEVFIGTAKYSECAALCQQIINGDFGTYSLAEDYRDVFSPGNENCPEVIFAFASADQKIYELNNLRNTPFLPYNFEEFLGYKSTYGGWNCQCLSPSYDNSGTIQEWGGTEGAVCFLDAPYNDKLGAVYERFNDKDIRKQNFKVDDKGEWNGGIMLKGAMKNLETGESVKADADRDGKELVYVDQVGTFQNLGRNLETVMSSRWGETNSGLRILKYPIYPAKFNIDYLSTCEVEMRLSEVYFMLAECQLRSGGDAKTLVNQVRQRYFNDSDWNAVKDEPGRGFAAFDMDWMLNMWGQEFLNEGRRRRTDLRRFDKFTQGQWWFFGRATDDAGLIPATRDRMYEWFPLPQSALLVNPGLVQNPNY